MAMPILAAPVLGRLYHPADYGALAQYMAPAAVLGVLASLQFQHAIIAERSDRTAGHAAWLCLLSALGASGLTAVMVAILWESVLMQTEAGVWFVALPFTVVGAGVVSASQFLANRHRRYRWIATLQVIHVAITIAVSICLGYAAWGTSGLLAAYLLGQTIQLGAYSWFMYNLGPTHFHWPGIRRLKVLMRRHWKFPAFTMPSEFSSQLNLQAPVFALSALGAEATLGAFTRARQLVSMPTTVVGQSVAQVFRRDASELYRKTGSCRKLMLRTAGGLLMMGIGPCLLLMIFSPWLFTVYLGPDWREAGEIARILAPMLLMRVIVSPLSTVFYFTGHQVLDLKLTFISTVIMVLFMTLGWMLMGTTIGIILAFTLGYGIVYLIYMVATFKLAGP